MFMLESRLRSWDLPRAERIDNVHRPSGTENYLQNNLGQISLRITVVGLVPQQPS